LLCEQPWQYPDKGELMSATLIARQKVSDYEPWRKLYNDAEPIRARHGCTGESVLRSPKDHDLVFVTHHFPTVEQTEAFAADPELHVAMARAGVIGIPASRYSKTSHKRRRDRPFPQPIIPAKYS
jgi:hypothetical protein